MNYLRKSVLVFVSVCGGMSSLSLTANADVNVDRYKKIVQSCHDDYYAANLKDAERDCSESIQIAKDLRSDILLIIPMNLLGLAKINYGSVADGTKILEDARVLALKTLDRNDIEMRALIATISDNLGLAYTRSGRDNEALALFNEDLKFFQDNARPRDAATTLANRSIALLNLYRDEEAVSAGREAVLAADKQFGGNSLEAARSRTNLAEALLETGRISEGIELLRRSIAILDSLFPSSAYPDGVADLAYAERSLGMAYEALENYPEAITALRRATDRLTKLTPDSSDLAATENNLAIALENSGDIVGARPHYQTAENILKKGGYSPLVLAIVWDHLGRIATQTGDCTTGRQYSNEAIAAIQQLLGPRAKDLAIAFANSGLNKWRCSGPSAALADYERATAILEQQVDSIPDAVSPTALSEQRAIRDIYDAHLQVLAILLGGHEIDENDPRFVEAFRVVQLGLLTSTSLTIAKHAATQLGGNSSQRQLNEKIEEWQRQERLQIDALSRGDQNAAVVAGQEMDRLARATESLREQAASGKLAVLHDLRPAAIADLRRVLSNHEAVLVFSAGQRSGVVVVVTARLINMYQVNMNRAALDTAVSRVLSGLVADRCGVVGPFDADAAYSLYDAWFAPAQDTLDKAAITQLLIVPDGPLGRVPPEVLVTEKSIGEIQQNDSYRFANVPWLAARYAVTIAPSVDSIIAVAPRPSQTPLLTTRSFLGFGAPNLEGGQPLDCTNAWLGLSDPPIPDNVRALGSYELQSNLATVVNKISALFAQRSTLLNNDATVSRLKALAGTGVYEAILFATHGLMGANDFKGLDEPALVTTPLPNDQRYADGLLRASDIALLDLPGEYVVVAACNSAAADSRTGEPALSGLARAFFAAGARSLLVSYWYVPSAAASETTLPAIVGSLVSSAHETRAMALHRAKVKLIASTDAANPRIWAAFELVGFGGAKPFSDGGN